jgi:putative ABC transport system permease protein
MIGYRLRLALLSIRRNPVLSAVQVVSLAIGVAVWVTARGAVTAAYVNPLPGADHLYEVTVARPASTQRHLRGERYAGFMNLVTLFVSSREERILTASPVPGRRTATAEVETVVEAPDGSLHAVRTNFCGGDLFALFRLGFVAGGAWSPGAEAGAAAEVVIAAPLALQLFGSDRDAVGRSLRVNGRRFTVAGVLRAEQPKHYMQVFLKDRTAEDLFLPLVQVEAVGARPLYAFEMGPELTWLTYWVELPDDAARAAFVVDTAARGVPVKLHAFAEVIRSYRFIHPAYTLLYVFSQIALVASALNLLRLLLAKFSARSGETGVHRAMGASRRSVVAQRVLEAWMIGLAGGAAGLLAGAGCMAALNSLVPDRHADAVLDGGAVVISLALASAIGAAAGCYSAWRATRVAPALFLRSQ